VGEGKRGCSADTLAPKNINRQKRGGGRGIEGNGPGYTHTETCPAKRALDGKGSFY